MFFGCKLEDVSLEVLITYPDVKKYLNLYHKHFSDNEFGHAIAQCKIAMKVLLHAYLKQNGRNTRDVGRPAMYSMDLPKAYFSGSTNRYLDAFREDILSLNEAIFVMNLGINYFKYEEFICADPFVRQWAGEKEGEYRYEYYFIPDSQFSEDTAKACYDFVIETALKLMGSKVFLY